MRIIQEEKRYKNDPCMTRTFGNEKTNRLILPESLYVLTDGIHLKGLTFTVFIIVPILLFPKVLEFLNDLRIYNSG